MYREIGDKFEQKVLEVASAHTLANIETNGEEFIQVTLNSPDGPMPYTTAKTFNLTVSISDSEIEQFLCAYKEDKHFNQVLTALRGNHDPLNPPHSQYKVGDNGLLYF